MSSLISDHAVALAKVVVEMFNLRPEEEREAFQMVYEACAAMLQSYEEKAARME